MILCLQSKDDRGAKLISIPVQAHNRRRSGEKGCFAEMGRRIVRRSVGRRDKIPTTVTLREALSFFPCMALGLETTAAPRAVVVFVYLADGKEE